MRASGRYDERLDAQLTDLYSGRFGSPVARPKLSAEAAAAEAAAAAAPSGFSEASQQLGNSNALLHDADEPNTVMPKLKHPLGTSIRMGRTMPPIKLPPKAARVHDSKFVVRDVGGRGRLGAARGQLVVGDCSGAVRVASNKETLYRSWHTRYWAAGEVSPGSTKGWPFPDAEENEPRGGDKRTGKKQAFFIR